MFGVLGWTFTICLSLILIVCTASFIVWVVNWASCIYDRLVMRMRMHPSRFVASQSRSRR